jgi:glycosyltransferase involved in cell wall biosynthesis
MRSWGSCYRVCAFTRINAMTSTNTLAANPAQSDSFVGCTLIHLNELPNAAVLANSFLHFHPNASFVVLTVDGVADQAGLPKVKLLSVADLGLDPGEEWRLPMLLSHRDLLTYLEPLLIEFLARTHGSSVACFSSSTKIFGNVADVFEMAEPASAILATEPIQNELGDRGRSFIGAPSGSAAVLREWVERSRMALATAGDDSFEGLFETVPHRLVAWPRFAVNYSNLNPASLTRLNDGYEIDAQPLLSFDFRGYDPDKPHLLSRYLGVEPRILLSEHPLVAELCDNYHKQLLEAGYTPNQSAHRSSEFLPSGLRLDTRMLRAYRKAFAEFRSGASGEPPSPFGPEGEQGFLKWLNEPIDQARKGVSRYMLTVYEDRPDVMKAFPDPTNRDAALFRHWYLAYGAQELNLPSAVVPQRTVVAAGSGPAVVNVAGYFRAELGIGTAARSLITALEAADIPINTVPFDRTANRLGHQFTDRSTKNGNADLNVLCINPDQMNAFTEQAGPEFFAGRYNVGVWFWEVEDFPVSLHHAFNQVDEIWVASEFMRQTFLKVSPKPIFKFLLPVLPPTIDRSLTRAELKLPEEFIFLFSFDFLSVLERKNPLGLVQAFTTAFAVGEGPCLVIKTINGDKRTLELEKLKYAIRDRPDIVLMDGYLDAERNTTLTALSDCYVSLHRSEGFGLTIAEAMALGKPAIATDYSGNLEFMTPENSYLCSSSRLEVGPEREPYPADSHWSEPDVTAGAKLLRWVCEHREEAKALGARAAAAIRSSRSPAIAGRVIRDRLSVIRRRLAEPRPDYSIAFLRDRIDELEARLSEKRTENK